MLLRIGVVIINFICAASYGAERVIADVAFRLIGALLDSHPAQSLFFLSQALVRVLLRLGTSPAVVDFSGCLTHLRRALLNDCVAFSIERLVLLDGIQNHKTLLRRQLSMERIR